MECAGDRPVSGLQLYHKTCIRVTAGIAGWPMVTAISSE